MFDKKKEKSLEDTVKRALEQIKDKGYEEELLELGFEKKFIKHYGFGFEGKEVLLGEY